MNQNQNPAAEKSDELEIDLLELLRELWKNVGLLVIAALVCGIIAFAGTIFFVKPTYRSSLTAFVNNRTADNSSETIASGDVSAARSLTYTYAAIIKSRPVLEDAAKLAGLDEKYAYENLRGAVTTSIEDNTQLVNVYVTLRSPEDACAIADAICDVAPAYVADIVEGSSMKIVTYPVLPTSQYSPNARKNLMIGMLLGIVLMAAFVVIRFLNDNRIKSESELESLFGLPIIGSIPNFSSAGSSGSYSNYYYQKSPTGEKKGGK